MEEEPKVDANIYIPDWDDQCLTCGQSPCVVIETQDGTIYTNMCGCCCFGEAECLNPENW